MGKWDEQKKLSKKDLKNLKVVKPCTSDWEGLSSSERTKFCNLCQKDVYNVEKMTEREVLKVLNDNGGSACLRIKRNEDGSIVYNTQNIIQRNLPSSVSVTVALASLSFLSACGSENTQIVKINLASDLNLCSGKRIEIFLKEKTLESESHANPKEELFTIAELSENSKNISGKSLCSDSKISLLVENSKAEYLKNLLTSEGSEREIILKVHESLIENTIEAVLNLNPLGTKINPKMSVIASGVATAK
jgi:hypothetical protein